MAPFLLLFWQCKKNNYMKEIRLKHTRITENKF